MNRRRINQARSKKKRAKRPAPPRPPEDLFTLIFRTFIDAYFPGILDEPIAPSAPVAIPPEMYRKLLMLCHPDKHGNSETATEVTRWLLEQREKTK